MRFALVAAALVAVMPSPARACSPPMCWAGAFLPAAGSTVPANLPGILWQPMGTQDEPDVTLVELRDDAGNTIALTATARDDGNFLLVPASKLVPGTHYQLVDHTVCKGYDGTDYSAQYPSPHSAFTAAAEAPLPTSLGDTETTDEGIGSISQGTSNGSCSVQVSADRETLMLDLAPVAQPWRDLLVYRTSIDGQAWSSSTSINQLTPPGQSSTGRATDRVYTRCADADGSQFAGLSLGSHIGLFSATLPGTTVTLTSGTASFTTSCEDPTMVPDPGVDPQPSNDTGGCSTGGGVGGASLLVLLVLRRRATRSSVR